MGRPYSMDLRERAIAAVVTEGRSRNEAARRLGIAVSTVVSWVRRFVGTGSAAPGKIGGYRPKAIRGEDRDWLLQRIAAKDFTLRGLVAELATERGLTVDYRTMWNFVHDEGLSFKKKRSGQRARSSRHRPPA